MVALTESDLCSHDGCTTVDLGPYFVLIVIEMRLLGVKMKKDVFVTERMR